MTEYKDIVEQLVVDVAEIKELLKNAVDNDTIYDDTDLWAVLGIDKTTDFTDENFVPLANRISGGNVEEALEDLLDEAIASEDSESQDETEQEPEE